MQKKITSIALALIIGVGIMFGCGVGKDVAGSDGKQITPTKTKKSGLSSGRWIDYNGSVTALLSADGDSLAIIEGTDGRVKYSGINPTAKRLVITKQNYVITVGSADIAVFNKDAGFIQSYLLFGESNDGMDVFYDGNDRVYVANGTMVTVLDGRGSKVTSVPYGADVVCADATKLYGIRSGIVWTLPLSNLGDLPDTYNTLDYGVTDAIKEGQYLLVVRNGGLSNLRPESQFSIVGETLAGFYTSISKGDYVAAASNYRIDVVTKGDLGYYDKVARSIENFDRRIACAASRGKMIVALDESGMVYTYEL